MYFEVYALSSASVAATEVHTGKNTWPTRVRLLSDGQFEGRAEGSAVSSTRSLTKIQREKAGAAAIRRGGSAAAPLGGNRRTGDDVGLEGFVIERILHFDASADR